MRRHRISIASIVVVAVGAASLVAIAIAERGYPVRHVDLNDGGIWVTSARDHLFGRLNKPAAQLDAAMYPPGSATAAAPLDTRQQSAAVVGWDQTAGKLYPIDVEKASIAKDRGVGVAPTDDVAMNGGTLAVLDRATGKIRALRYDPSTGVGDLAALDNGAKTKPLATIEPGPTRANGSATTALAVGIDGTVVAASTSGDLLVIPPASTGFASPRRSRIGVRITTVQVTVVGSASVVFDPESGVVVLPGGKTIHLDGTADARLQAPSAADSSVVVATTHSLVAIDLGSGRTSRLFDGANGQRPAQPTWLGSCVYAAWRGSPGQYEHSCAGEPATAGNVTKLTSLQDPVFRVNRDAIVLNDLQSGAVFDLDTGKPVGNWDQVKPPPVIEDTSQQLTNNPSPNRQDQPPKAVDDTFGVRTGRTTVLHVLDNDSDPQGYVLSIAAVGGVDDPTASVGIAPDGQAVLATLPSAAKSLHFTYTIDDGKGLSATAGVEVHAAAGADTPPRLRAGYTPVTGAVTVGGTLSLSVLGDWRDDEGDPVVLNDAKLVNGAGTVTTTSDGRVTFVAPANAGAVTLQYSASDGIAGTAPVPQEIPVTVLAAGAGGAVAAKTAPDIARGVVGRPISVHPLDNDLPGVDPSNPDATLAIGARIASPDGAVVSTDLDSGLVTVLANRPGSFELTYIAAFGNAPFSTETKIRIDVSPAPTTSPPPVAMPDNAVVHGQSPNTVDLLANDYDPAGGVLVVQRADVVNDLGQVQVGIVQGRWLRVQALAPVLNPNPQVIRYSVSNGAATATGEVTVTWLPDVPSDVPLPQDDDATVRAGDSVAVPVLDNDTSPGGSPLTLSPVVAGAPAAGQLPVSSTTAATDKGAAFVSGQLVRYVAPSSVTTQLTVIVDYVAQNAAGDQATGHLRVTVMPEPTATNPDLPPAPKLVEARVVAGDRVKVSIPSYGVDPDGDSVSVAGIGSAPTLGRIVATSATAITYEAFPKSAGTDSFTYRVVDRYGKSGDATVRVAVTAPSAPQPPVAVDDAITAAPGAHLQVDVLANDLRAEGDSVSIAPAGAKDAAFPEGVTLASPTGAIKLTAPAAEGKPLVVLYELSNGIGQPSVAKLTVRSLAQFNNPPRAFDAYAQPKPGATSVRVNVLAKDFDPDGSPLQLVDTTGLKVSGNRAVVTVAAGQAFSVPYQIKDRDGATASAVIHVSANGAGAPPYARPGKVIEVGKNATTTIDIADYVVDPGGKSVRLTTTDKISAAPGGGLAAANKGDTQLTISSSNDYVGPAAVTFEVTNGDSLRDNGAEIATITVPVQVGPTTPVLRCPTDPIAVVEGGEPVAVDVGSVCHVWAPDPSVLAQMKFKATWSKQPSGVSVDGSGSHVVGISASGSASPGDTGTLSVSVVGADAEPSTLSVVVVAASPPSVAPVVIDGFKVGAGVTATVDLTPYVRSQLRDPKVTVVDVTQTSGGEATARKSGPKVEITPGGKTSGALTFTVVVSDVADPARSDRHASGAITMNLLNVPDAPTGVVPDRTVLSHTVQLSWATPNNNGAPIDHYFVESAGGSVSQQCSASPCTITNLTNGRDYAFTVKAHNLVGMSDASAPSPSARPDAFPDAVTGLAVSNPQDHALTLTWNAAHVDGTPVTSYRVTWTGGGSQTVPGATTTTVPTGLVNDSIYTFTVIAVNDLGPGAAATVVGQSAGKPATPGAPTFSATNDTAGNSRVVVLSWAPVDPNGIAPTSYVVTRTGRGTTPLACANPTATTCNDSGIALDGTVYQYTIIAKNAAAATDATNHTSSPGPATSMEATATPEPITGIGTVVAPSTPDGQVPATFNVGASHGATSTVNCSYSGGSCGSASFPPAGQAGAAMTLSFPAGFVGTFTLRDCNGSTQSDSQAGSACNGGTLGPGPATPNGPPNAPGGVNCTVNGSTAHLAWQPAAQVGARAVASYDWTISGISSGNAAGPNVNGVDVGGIPADGQLRAAVVTTIDSQGGRTSASTSCQDPAPPLPPSISASMGSSGSATGCTVNCNWLRFTPSANFPSGAYQWQCLTNGVVSFTSSSTYPFSAGTTYETAGSSGFCIWGISGATEQIKINGITSNPVTHP